MKYDITLRKGRNGWTAETRISMGQANTLITNDPGERFLKISTDKASHGGIYSTARCEMHRPDGCITTVIFGDYHKNIERSPARCTEKSIREMQERAVAQADALLADATAFYQAKEQERMRQTVKDEIRRGAAPALATNQTVRELSGDA